MTWHQNEHTYNPPDIRMSVSTTHTTTSEWAYLQPTQRHQNEHTYNPPDIRMSVSTTHTTTSEWAYLQPTQRHQKERIYSRHNDIRISMVTGPPTVYKTTWKWAWWLVHRDHTQRHQNECGDWSSYSRHNDIRISVVTGPTGQMKCFKHLEHNHNKITYSFMC